MTHPKTLLLVRHAKSSWEDEDLDDIDRPLNARGERNAPEMGRRLLARKMIPNRIVSSSATRALMTASAIAGELEYDLQRIEVADDLYGAGPDDVVDIVKRFDTSDETAMIVGHNPTMTELANLFSTTVIENVPTCGVLVVRTPGWHRIETDGELLDFDYPKRTFPADR